MSGSLKISGQTPVRNEAYSATLIFDREAQLIEVLLESKRSKGTYTVEDLGAILGFIRQQKTGLALWNESREPDTLQKFFSRRKWPAMCGCMADLLEQMGLASVQIGPPVRISGK